MDTPSGLTAAQVQNSIHSKFRKIMGFARKPIPKLEAMQRVSLYIFNVSDTEYAWQQAGFKRVVVKACEKDKPYSDPFVIMEMYAEEYLGSSDSTDLNWYSGEEIANAAMWRGQGLAASLDMGKRGLFVSSTNPPSQAEVSAAKQALRETMNKLLVEADAIHAGLTKNATINEEHRRAAAYLGQPRDWSREHIAMISCPECGQPVSETASIHFGPGACGAVLNWDRAVKAGLKKESDRPDYEPTLTIKEKK